MSEGPLADQLALVTGASRGIGAATAEALAAAGAHVVLTARTAGALEEIEERIFAAGGSATIAPLDLTDGDSIGRLAAAVTERWGKLDMLVLNAARLGSLTPVPSIEPKEFSEVMTLNVSAQVAMLAAFDGLLRRADQARVIGVTSRIAREPRAYWGPYAASKAAFETLLLTYGDEVRQITKVRVAIVDPGATRTKMRARAFPGEDPATLNGPEVPGARIAALMAAGFDAGHFERVE